MKAGRVDQTITDLKPAEQQWVAGNVELAGKISSTMGLDVAPGKVIGPEALDTAWAAWLAGHVRAQVADGGAKPGRLGRLFRRNG